MIEEARANKLRKLSQLHHDWSMRHERDGKPAPDRLDGAVHNLDVTASADVMAEFSTQAAAIFDL